MYQVEVHTDDPDVRDMCYRYWATDESGAWVETVKQIAASHSRPPSAVSRLVAESAAARRADVTCHACAAPLALRTRSDVTSHGRWKCEQCREADRRQQLEEARARQGAEEEELRRRADVIQERYGEFAAGHEICAEDLTLRQAVALLAMIREGAEEDYSSILPLGGWETPLAPTAMLRCNLTVELWHSDVIAIHPQSPVDAFAWHEAQDASSVYVDRVRWYVPSEADVAENLRRLHSELTDCFVQNEWVPAWRSEWGELWLELVLHEALAYLDTMLAEHGLELKAGEKTIDTLRYACDSMTLGQVYNVIWAAARDAAAYWVRERVPKQRAANSTVGSIRRRVERALAEGWDIKAYRRDRRCPETAVVRVFFPLVVKADPFSSTAAAHARPRSA